METILIATDFSTASKSAFKYGVELAGRLNAKVILLHVYKSVLPAGDMVIWVTLDELKENADGLLLNEVQSLQAPLTVEVETRSEEGSAVDVILSVAENEKVSWIVAGIRENHVQSEYVLGRTATDLRRRTDRPLLLVPESALFKVPENIAFASDYNVETDICTLDPLQELGEKFNVRLYIVRVIKKGMNEVFEMLDRPTVLQSYLKDLHPAFEFPKDNNVAHAMNEFVKNNCIDMIVMIKPHDNFIERIFSRSDTKQMILKTKVPLIILPEKVGERYTIKENGSLTESKV